MAGIDNISHLVLLAAIALIVLGPKRLPRVARALGEGIREFRSAFGDAAEGRDRAPDGRVPSGDAPDNHDV